MIQSGQAGYWERCLRLAESPIAHESQTCVRVLGRWFLIGKDEFRITNKGRIGDECCNAALHLVESTNDDLARMLKLEIELAHSEPDKAVKMVVVHYMQFGHTACMKPGVPKDWPVDTWWSACWDEVNCEDCLKGRKPMVTYTVTADGSSITCLTTSGHQRAGGGWNIRTRARYDLRKGHSYHGPSRGR